MTCENALFGNALQLNIVAFYPRQCASQDENICKIQFQEQLKNILDKLLIIPMTIQFSKNRFKKIDIKICNLIEITGKFKNNISRKIYYYLLGRRR